MVRISPETATVISGNEEKTLPIDKVSVGDCILVKPGERIPVDAIFLSGVSAVVETAMTVEPLPVEKNVGDALLAGALNHNRVITAKAIKVGRNLTMGKVINLISEAGQYRLGAVRLADRFATWFSSALQSYAAIAWILTEDISRAVAVLIVGIDRAYGRLKPQDKVDVIKKYHLR